MQARVKFYNFEPLVFRLLWGSILDTNKCIKSSPRGPNIQSQTSFEKTCLYGSDSGANVAPAWPQLGPMLASKIDQKSILKVWAPPKAPLGPSSIDTEANLAPTWPNLAQLGPNLDLTWTYFDQFLIVFY